MARYCVCGCGSELKDKNGNTDYKRYFFNAEHRDKDKTQKMRDQRARIKKMKRCSHCNQRILSPAQQRKVDLMLSQGELDDGE